MANLVFIYRWLFFCSFFTCLFSVFGSVSSVLLCSDLFNFILWYLWSNMDFLNILLVSCNALCFPWQVRNTTALDWCMDDNFIKVRTVRYLRDLSHHQILNVYNRDLIANPRGTFQMLCDFVSVSCYTAFVELAKNDLYSKLSRTRYMIEWSNERKEKVTREIQKFYCLKSHFSFESD